MPLNTRRYALIEKLSSPNYGESQDKGYETPTTFFAKIRPDLCEFGNPFNKNNVKKAIIFASSPWLIGQVIYNTPLL
jgi:hypothetical protein